MRLSPNELRRKYKAVSNLLGIFPRQHVRFMTQRILERGLLEDGWKRRHNAIFIHIPKAAGRSVEHTLDLPVHDIWHIPADAYRQADPQFFAAAYKFSIARNPWSRLVSGFHFIMKGDEAGYAAVLRQNDLRGVTDFGSFLERMRGTMVRNQLLTRIHFMPQSHFLCDRDGKLLVDRVAKFERLPDSFNEIAEPLDGDFQLASRNRGSHDDYRTYYKHDWQIELVGKMYARDCQVLDYSFEGGPLDTIRVT